ncbi:bifunctional serine/threonine-protein kinase/formylglycine-generating enzyme family protein [Biformimicrobium ophioploci]|uniref:Protein kinase domain-containing protein n=1 Tax=Biformimicrobium ophioploci TaxID=3036711 RepID=A0ABQ6M1B6_9GAMM|nr:bifunctional serine/threonine-protein kinase/formylglycine-generating enzyme family protein [Microbulbifer sp. NKW57]GMG88153.1 hypothetical protein MNKW57_24740 [Microbulbifer sp. NKW57]
MDYEAPPSSGTLEIPGYRILKKINQGGMSTVYLAIQRSVGRQVALKVMSPVLNADPVFGERFQREANIVGQLSHPNIVGIHDIGRYRSLNYIAMDYLSGGSISDKLATAIIEPLEALQYTREVAMALDHAHSKGYVHRDLKPENILFREDGSTVLTDFGVARAIAKTTRNTTTGMVVGTPHYMSPEQARGVAVDGRADLYSLGVVFYEMLTGTVPFQADEAVAIAIKHLTDPVPRLPARFALYQNLINRFLAKDPEKRFQRGLEVVDAIDQLIAAMAGKAPSQVSHLNNTSIGLSSLVRALLLTLLATVTERMRGAFSYLAKDPQDQQPQRAEQETLMRIQEIIRHAPRKRSRLRVALTSVAVVASVWLLLSSAKYFFGWQPGGPEVLDRHLAQTGDWLYGDESTLGGAEIPPPGQATPVSAVGPVNGEPQDSMLAAGVTPLESPSAGAAVEGTPDNQAESTDLSGVVVRAPSIPDTAQPANRVATAPDPAIKAQIAATTEETRPEDTDPAAAETLAATPSGDGSAANDETGRDEVASNEAARDKIVTAPAEAAADPTYRLTVKPTPAGARVRIMNIRERYQPGMALAPGRYEIEVSADLFRTTRKWVTLSDDNLQLPVNLEPEARHGKQIQSRLASGGRGPEMIVIQPGAFELGNERRAPASPQKPVKIQQPFALSKTEVRFADYRRFAEATGRPLPANANWAGDDRPVINVSWEDAKAYTEWLSNETGRNYRLPSEAEWEYAARAGRQSIFWWGERDARGKANCRRGCDSDFITLFGAKTAPVGSFSANPFGLYDTAGNVAEWVQDCYWSGHDRNPGNGAPVEIRDCRLRAVKGGSMRDPLRNISADYRKGLDAEARQKDVGFRVLLELPDSDG